MALTVAQFNTYCDKVSAIMAASYGDLVTTGDGDQDLGVADVALTGTVSSAGTLVTGSATAFTTEIAVGQVFKSGSYYGVVQMICSDTKLVLGAAPSSPLSSATAYKAAGWGCHREAKDLENAIIGTASIYSFGDWDVISRLQGQAHALLSKYGWQKRASDLRDALDSLATTCAAAGITGVSGIDTFASYYNTGAGGPAAGLMPPIMQQTWDAIYGVNLTARNVYPPPIPNMGQKAVGGAFVAGPAVDATLFSGYPRLGVSMTSFGGSADTVTLAVSGYTAAGVAGTDNWTVSVTGNGTFAVTAGSVVKFVTQVSGITIGASISAGTVVSLGSIPLGRVMPTPGESEIDWAVPVPA